MGKKDQSIDSNQRQSPAKPRRQRLPMDEFRAAYACGRIMSQLSDVDRAAVVDFIRSQRQLSLGNA